MAEVTLAPSEMAKLSSQRADEVRQGKIRNKLADKLVVYLLWTLLAPAASIALGAAGAVEALKPGTLYAFSIGVVLTGFGELVTRSTELHRRMHLMLWASTTMLFVLIFCWIYAAKSDPVACDWRTVSLVSATTAVIVGADIVIGVIRDTREELRSWVR